MFASALFGSFGGDSVLGVCIDCVGVAEGLLRPAASFVILLACFRIRETFCFDLGFPIMKVMSLRLGDPPLGIDTL